MTSPAEMLRHGSSEEVWQRYMGFLDLTLDEFMSIQRRRILEHVAWLSDSELGRKIIGPTVPTSVEEFRERVPLTTYADYAPYLLERKSDALPGEPFAWMRTSGRSGEYSVKWAPIFRDAWEEVVRPNSVAILLMASSKQRGEVNVEIGDVMPFTWAPTPFGLGYMALAITEELPLVVIPSLEAGGTMSFDERIGAALTLGFRLGIDHFFGLASVLVKIGERFSEGSSARRGFSKDMLHPKVLWRLIRAKLRARAAGRPMYPKDLWDVKGVSAGGSDTSIFAARIEKYWGVKPLEMYGTSEFAMAAIQAWDREGMTPLPDMVFFEFIPLEESRRSRSEPNYVPKTLLLNEVQAGETYEIVLSSFRFTPFTRYRVGDLVRVSALRNEQCNIDLPQLVFEGRCDDVIDLAGFTRLTERTIWYAIENTGIPYEEWICRKEYEGDSPVLHVWIEPKNGAPDAADALEALRQCLREQDSDYRDLEAMLGYNPLRLEYLSPGTFFRFMLDRQSAGVEPAHFKPRHFVHGEETLQLVLSMHEKGR